MNAIVENPSFIEFGTNRAPTRNDSAEQFLIGCFIRDESRISECLAIAPAVAWKSKYAFLAAEYERRLAFGESLDPNVIVTHLTPEFPQVDQLAADALESVPHAGQAIHFAKLIHQANQRYRAIHLAGQFAEDIGEQNEFDAVVANYVSELTKLCETAASDMATSAVNGIASVIEQWECPAARGLTTGFAGLNQRINGLQQGRLYVIAAPTGIGKSALAANIGWYVARTSSVLFISLEMSRLEVFERGLCSELNLTVDEMKRQMRSEEGSAEFTSSSGLLSQRQMYVDDRVGRNISQIAAAARRHKLKFGLDLLIVDYIQLISPTDRKVSRNEQIGEISRGLKLVAKSLEIPVIALSQLNRAGSSEGIRPQLYHLRESGSIEQDSDVVAFIFRDRHKRETELLIEKNRSGPTGVVKLNWIPELVKFEEVPWDSGAEDFAG